MSDLKLKDVLDTVSVFELLGNDFYVPDYQRGYRWTELEVTKLLKDLKEFFVTAPGGKNFYCLQPLVTYWNSEEEKWELIDGQQRLTTIYLILQIYRDSLKAINGGEDALFSLSYQSRPGSELFLKNIDYTRQNENIDYYHFVKATECIKEFIKNNYPGIKAFKDFIEPIIEDGSKSAPVKFIWYNVTNEVDSKKITREEKFSDLNVGKIGLTNAELIKALLLSGVKGNNSEALRIASEWDSIEHALQESEFWAFIYGLKDKKYATRIELLFDLVKKKFPQEENEYFTFDKYVEELDGLTGKDREEKVKSIWQTITNKFYLIRGWYEDRKLYHIIGYLRYLKINIKDIEEIFNDPATKDSDDYYKKLRTKAINETLKGNNIEDLDYNDSADKKRIRDVLLLSNVLTAIECEKSNYRFSFDQFYKHSYDIEHVRSQTPKDLDGESRADWIYCNVEYFSGVDYHDKTKEYEKDFSLYEKDVKSAPNRSYEVVSKITAGQICEDLLALLSSKTVISKSKVYDILVKDVFKQDAKFKYEHQIGNLVLLDQGTNRGYRNAFFPVKRKWINRREREGIYLLPCTKNVFSKNYSNTLIDLMNWNNNDAEYYMLDIERLLED